MRSEEEIKKRLEQLKKVVVQFTVLLPLAEYDPENHKKLYSTIRFYSEQVELLSWVLENDLPF